MTTKRTYSETELQKEAEACFKRFPAADSVFATTDGNVFLDRNRAELHAGKGKVVQFDRALPEPEAPAAPTITAKDAIAQIAVATLEDLAAFADDNRKTVQDAYQKRLIELGINAEEGVDNNSEGVDNSPETTNEE